MLSCCPVLLAWQRWVFFIRQQDLFLHAGLAARMSTQLARERAEETRLAEEETDFERIVSMGLGPLDALDEEQEVGCLLWHRCLIWRSN